jgi:hypothetical protein
MSVVARSHKDGTKVVHMALLRKELYSPMTPTNKEGAWRMELPVDIEDTYDDGCEDEINKSDSQVETRDYESESSMSVSM